jgi:hypothetical protein
MPPPRSCYAPSSRSRRSSAAPQPGSQIAD